jgi:hypothetical protein
MNKKALFLTAAITGIMAVAHADQHAKDAASAGAAATPTGECSGINTCKNTGQCGGAGHSCAGQNKCKGLGWVTKTEAECKAAKGKWKKS